MKTFIYYLPRTLSMLIVLFFAMFILEGFSPDFGWQDSLAHLILTLVFLAVTIVAWKWPGIGGWIFAAAGIFYLYDNFNLQRPDILIIGGIPLITGILFLAEGLRKWKTGVENKPDKNKK